MADSNLLEAKKALVAAFVEYVDWDGSAYAPRAVDFGTKREAAPTDLLDLPDLVFPAVALQVEYSLGARYGYQTAIDFHVRVSIIAEVAAGAQPENTLEDLTGRMIDNIRLSYAVEGAWLGLDWVADIAEPRPQPSNNSLDALLRMNAADQDLAGKLYCASQTDFTVIAYTVRSDF